MQQFCLSEIETEKNCRFPTEGGGFLWELRILIQKNLSRGNSTITMKVAFKTEIVPQTQICRMRSTFRSFIVLSSNWYIITLYGRKIAILSCWFNCQNLNILMIINNTYILIRLLYRKISIVIVFFQLISFFVWLAIYFCFFSRSNLTSSVESIASVFSWTNCKEKGKGYFSFKNKFEVLNHLKIVVLLAVAIACFVSKNNYIWFYHMFSSKYSSFAYLINSLLFNPYRATLMRTLYRIPFITPLLFFFFFYIKSVLFFFAKEKFSSK